MTPAGDLSRLGRLWLIGCGNMGGALLGRWLDAGLSGITVIDPNAGDRPGVATSITLPADGTPDIVVLAVKPQIWLAATAELTARLAPSSLTRPTLIVSVMAGIGTAALAARFGGSPIVRTMPNTPARIGQGVTALFGLGVDASNHERATLLMAAAGDTVWLDREQDFDAVTAVSGSGPAYVFAFIEALAAAGEAAGLSADLAARLALGTVTGAAALAAERSASPAELRVAVTSPNGTTAAGLAVLQDGLPMLARATVAAAQSRSHELGRAA